MTVQCPSPSSSRPSVSFTHLVAKLDSLASFYQQQLDWVDETRAQVKVVEMETDGDDDDEEPLSETEAPTPSPQPAANALTAAALRRVHWRRQMRSLESKLNGKIHKHHRPKSSRPLEGSSQYILSMFEQMMGARIQSCHRIQKLVAVTSRSDGKLGARG
ncbi:hypothetical protein B0H17DRAFT_1073396 [Mycena rosella]|uniref:Uncharacterized protein n=1 Tax=Mycena rosella TaxID=1033263 RepID=A0AAD7GAT8_MYCRO|nr:hypothetical protein B0H17DRAFT_1073396 [Mycena rosella]